MVGDGGLKVLGEAVLEIVPDELCLLLVRSERQQVRFRKHSTCNGKDATCEGTLKLAVMARLTND